jgi:hypothetical protein
MISKNVRNIFFAFIMTFLMMLTIFSNTIAGAIIRGSNAIPFGDLSEEKEKTINTNENMLILLLGFMSADGVISSTEPLINRYIFDCSPVERVTVIGFGTYFNLSSPIHIRFFMKSYTNVSELAGITYRKFETSEKYRHFSLFITPLTICMLWFNNSIEKNRGTIVY